MLQSITETVELIQLNIEKVSTVNKSVSDITSDATSLGDNIKVVDSAVKQVENSNETLTANMNQVGEIMQIMTERINNAEVPRVQRILSLLSANLWKNLVSVDL